MTVSVTTNFSLLLILLTLLCSVIPKSNSTANYLISYCPTTPFPANTKYKTNLDNLLKSLATKVTENPVSFYSTSSANNTSDAVYGLYLCRGDQNATGCTDCVTTATTSDLRNIYCPSAMVAVIWYDECMVRYSNVSLVGKMSDSPFESLIDAVNGRLYEGNQTLFKEVVLNTMNGLVNRTSGDNNKNNRAAKYITRVVDFAKADKLYAMQQCTPDLSDNDCKRCLTIAISRLWIRKGASLLQPSCQIRYEIYPFYNGAVNLSTATTLPTSTPKNKNKAILIVVSVVAAMLILAASICLIIKTRARKYDAVPFKSVSEDFAEVESLQYDLVTLQAATRNFLEENKLGEGGFGSVYKGTLSNGQEIAVKRLSRGSVQGAQEFKTEVMLVAKLQHRRLVRLLGFCLAGEEKLLVYEYVPNISLDHFLFDPVKKTQLEWNARYRIIRGVAQGILYLHQDSQLIIIHRDLKASNVLLDADMNPKISDFGMAKICGIDQTHGNTIRVVGTYGYMAPEYAMQGKFSTKSDVYSFGVLMLEIISGKKNNFFYKSGYAEDLLTYAFKQWTDGTPLEFVDATIRNSCSINQVKNCMHLGLLCVQENVEDRPTMASAVLMLDGQSVSIPTPAQPGFFIKSTGGSSTFTSDQSVPWTINEASISEIEAR